MAHDPPQLHDDDVRRRTCQSMQSNCREHVSAGEDGGLGFHDDQVAVTLDQQATEANTMALKTFILCNSSAVKL